MFNAVDIASGFFDVFKRYNVERVLYAYGLCIDSDYRRRGIAVEMLKARASILQAFGLTVTSTAFTTVGSQIAARKAGFDEVYAISFDDLQKRIPNLDFSTSTTKMFKTLAMKI